MTTCEKCGGTEFTALVRPILEYRLQSFRNGVVRLKGRPAQIEIELDYDLQCVECRWNFEHDAKEFQINRGPRVSA